MSVAQLAALGIPETSVRSWARRGRLLRLHRGVYAVGHDRLRREGWWLAAVLACGKGAALSYATAAAALELRSSAARLIDVSVPKPRRGHAGIRVHCPQRLEPAEITFVSGIPVTDATRTLIDMSRTHSAATLENMAAIAEHRGLIDYGRIDVHMPLVLRRILGHGPKLVRARIERRLLDGLRAEGLPEPEANAWLSHGSGEEWQPDFLFRRERVIVELDDDTHRTRKAFALDREKDAVRQLDGYAVLRFTLERVDDNLAGVLRTIATLLARRNRS